MLKYIVAEIEVSETHRQRITVPVWELPIVAAVHGRSDPVIVEEVLSPREPPSAGDEFKRLESRYGKVVTEDGGQGAFWVAAVYGSFNDGVQKLGKAINGAVVRVVDDKLRTVEQTAQFKSEAPAAEDFGDLLGSPAEAEQVSSVGG